MNKAIWFSSIIFSGTLSKLVSNSTSSKLMDLSSINFTKSNYKLGIKLVTLKCLSLLKIVGEYSLGIIIDLKGT